MRQFSHFIASGILIFFASLACFAQGGDGAQQFADLGTCALVNGQQIEQCRLGYRTWGTLNASRSNAILIPTWFSGTSGQLASFVGANRMLDPAKYYIIAVDALGDGVSSSPLNSAAQHGPAFPAFAIRDMVNAEYRLATETLHLKHLHAVTGQSMGGMQTFEWMVDHSDFMDVAIPIVGSPKLTSYDHLVMTIEVNAIEDDPAWQGGHYTGHPPMPEAEDVLQMNLTTPTHYVGAHPDSSIETTEAEYSRRGILPFDANDWLAQLKAIEPHDVARGGSMEEAAKKVKARVLIVVAAQDHMVNPKPALAFAGLLHAQTLVLDSDCGHLSPGCQADKMYPVVRAFLAEQ